MKEIKPRSQCPVSYTLDFFGDKWSLLIVRDMMLYDKTTYGEFLGSDEKIATNILADRLSMLENCGFVTKKVGTDKRSKFIYEKGIGLVPVVVEMAMWGLLHHPSGMDKVLVNDLKKDKEGTIRELQNKLRTNNH